MSDLTRYENARLALAEVRQIDEVKNILDRAEALKEYARRAKDTVLIDDATAIKLNAERRLGEMIAEQKERIGLNSGTAGKGRPRKGSDPGERPKDERPTLAASGVDKKLSARAQKLAKMDQPDFEKLVKDATAHARKSVESTPEERAAEKKEKRAARETELAERIIALPEKRYGVIYADPPWRFEPYSHDTGMDRAADNHYPTAQLEQIKSVDVASVAADDCVLFLWATAPMLSQALEVMEHWGFEYRSLCIWVKDRLGTGYWFRNKHELLLVGTHGDIPAPAPGTQWESVIVAPVGVHSEKPEEAYEMIEDYFPRLPKIELYARAKREGWSRWGAEAPPNLGADSLAGPNAERSIEGGTVARGISAFGQ